jgi:AraC-like DNA-binding protein
MTSAFPQWRGFERAPRGYLLDQLVDLRGDMGVAYERIADFSKDVHAHDRLSLVCPRGACVMEMKTHGGEAGIVLDSGVLLVLPAGQPHDIRARSSVLDALALYPARALLDRVARENHISAPALRRFSGSVRRLRRSPWLDQLLVEYFSRRVLAGGGGARRPAADLRFLETEIVREVFRIAGLWQAQPGGAGKAEPGTAVAERALQYIEANLFGPLELDAIAKHAHASVSTLLRRFSERTGLTPLKYAGARRLDEARALLKQGTHNVTQVAMLVGYGNAGAFCEAFRARFGEPPSRVRRTRASTASQIQRPR